MSTATAAAHGPRQFVTFHLGDGQFGVPLSDVQEIIRVPDLIRVPLSPDALLGLANLRGSVLPVASLRRAFSLEDRPIEDSMRVVVLGRGATTGLLVDRVASVVTASPEEIDPARHLRDVSRSDLIEEVVESGGRRFLVFDPIRVLETLFTPAEDDDLSAGGPDLSGGKRASAAAEEALADERRLVTFSLAGEEYAFPVERVREIVTLRTPPTSVPKAPRAMVGLMVLRQEVLPLVSLRTLLGLGPVEPGREERVVVTTSESAGARISVGVVVDAVREVLRLPKGSIERVPALLRKNDGELESVCRLDDGRRLVTVLAVDALLDFDALDEAARSEAGEGGAMGEAETIARRAEDVEEQLVIFRLRNEAYGVPVDVVREIVRVPEEMTRVPRAPSFIEGVINLRGEVLPVIDQRTRFGLERAERNDRQRIVVLQAGGHRLGFVVDSVAEVRKIPARAIEAAPTLSPEQARLIRRVANLGERGLVLLLEPDRLLSSGEQQEVAASLEAEG